MTRIGHHNIGFWDPEDLNKEVLKSFPTGQPTITRNWDLIPYNELEFENGQELTGIVNDKTGIAGKGLTGAWNLI